MRAAPSGRRSGRAGAPLGGALLVGALVALPLPRVPEVSQSVAGSGLMRDLSAVAVVAERVHSEVRPYGLDDIWLARRVAAALARDSVPTVPRSMALTDARQPLLVVRLETVAAPIAGAYAWHLTLALQQRVRAAAGDSATALATTWEAERALGLATGVRLKGTVAASLDEQVRQFVVAWRGR